MVNCSEVTICWSTAASGTNGLWHNINPVSDGFKVLVPPYVLGP